MAVDVLTSIIISCPLKKVAAYASNPSNAPEWYVNIKSVEWKTPEIVEIGSKMGFQAQFMGRKLEYTYEIVEFLPNQKLVMRTAEGPFPMETTYTWEAIEENQTLMTLRNRGKPSGFSKWMAPLVVKMMRNANKKDLNKIKQILEQNNKT